MYQPLPESESGASGTNGRGQQQQQSRGRRQSRSLDLGKLDSAFKKWTENISQRMKALGKKRKEDPHERKEIARSVFDPPVSYPNFVSQGKTLDHKLPMSDEDYKALAAAVRSAINQGNHPKMISKGSSGSYFARGRVDRDGKLQTIGVFKPKDEEPYGRLNPKTTKWLHRKMRWLIPFGRSCLIPNLSYISEAAASLLDTRLGLNIVPKTELVSFSSTAFFYDWIDRSATKKGKPLPEKIGSMQLFMHGFTDASEFLRRHPLPDRPISDTYDDSTHRRTNLTKRFLSAVKVICGKTGGDGDDEYDYEGEEEEAQDMYMYASYLPPESSFHWTPTYIQEFREELEKLVILDYLMRNTDRGSDNYMIKACEATHEKSLIDVAPSAAEQPRMPSMLDSRQKMRIPINEDASYFSPIQTASHTSGSSYLKRPHIHIAAIDNSLSFPHEHPKGWRSYTYGWLYLPVSVIGRPFSEQTRKQILPLLTSKEWWEETTYQLRKLFAADPGYHPDMFRRQLAVIKGQAWNIVQCLKHSDEGPLELARRTKMLVWDDEVEVEEGAFPGIHEGPLSPSVSMRDGRLHGHSRSKRRSQSIGPSDFPPPIKRASTDMTGLPRPVSFASKFPRINPGASGVAVLEHMERLDAVEASLQRLGDDTVIEEADEDDQGDIGASPALQHSQPTQAAAPHTEALTTKQDDLERELAEVDESDITFQGCDHMAASMPHIGPRSFTSHTRLSSELQSPGNVSIRQQLDWIQSDKKKTVIAERLEIVKERSFFSCW